MRKRIYFILLAFLLICMPFTLLLADESRNVISYSIVDPSIPNDEDLQFQMLDGLEKYFSENSEESLVSLKDNIDRSNTPLTNTEVSRWVDDYAFIRSISELSFHLDFINSNKHLEGLIFTSEDSFSDFNNRLNDIQADIPDMISTIKEYRLLFDSTSQLSHSELEQRYTFYDKYMDINYVIETGNLKLYPDQYDDYHKTLEDTSLTLKKIEDTLIYLQSVELSTNSYGTATPVSASSPIGSGGDGNSNGTDFLSLFSIIMLGAFAGMMTGPAIRFATYKPGDFQKNIFGKGLEKLGEFDKLITAGRVQNFLSKNRENKRLDKDLEKIAKLMNQSDMLKKAGGFFKYIKIVNLAYSSYLILKNNDLRQRATWGNFGEESFKFVATAGATFTGAAVGGSVGAIVGGTVGSAFGPQGTIIGGTAGAFVGSQVGAYIGESVSSSYIEEKATFGEKVGNNVYDKSLKAESKFMEWRLKRNGL